MIDFLRQFFFDVRSSKICFRIDSIVYHDKIFLLSHNYNSYHNDDVSISHMCAVLL